MIKSVLMIVYIFIGVSCLIFLGLYLLKWREQQQELKRKATEQLMNRCYRILSIFDVLTDRYLPHQTKLLLAEYLLAIIPKLASEKYGKELSDRLPELIEMHKELKSERPLADNSRVESKEQLSKVQNALQRLPVLLKGFALNGITDRQTAKQEVELIRYSCCLAHHDLLVHQADADLDMDKKARALEKYRIALAEMERVISVGSADSDIKRLTMTIESVEKSLFIQRSAI